ncbi:hypothetical protein BDM02DRAFT_3089128 [Thelephora ganbajun]|uniref:Uncharacterized protein n=1 Tax=Thelephora ganbajun TaxID=370292 RepID=A0ACB6ZRI6_THEGA|nr:hypothetical protein BDM02DRAFT_3089128 [Thelephora ganbajun]
MISNNSAIHETVQRLNSELENADLLLLKSKPKFLSKKTHDDQEWPTSNDGPDALLPAVLAANKFLRNLKFRYLEQAAKKKYVVEIMSEEGPAISAADNEDLKAKNEEKKRALGVVKSKLGEKQKDIRDLAPLVEEDYEKAKTVIAEISSLSQQILDTRLALTRSKQRHPEPRLTVSSASAQLDSQIMKMQESADELQGVNAKVSAVKEDIKAKSKRLEALRSQRAEFEKIRSSKVDEVEDPRYAGLYDWYTAAIALHQSILGLETFRVESENELQLIYRINSTPEPHKLKVKLLFMPNTRQLADAEVTGIDEDLGYLVDLHVRSNDAPGLLVAVLARARDTSNAH